MEHPGDGVLHPRVGAGQHAGEAQREGSPVIRVPEQAVTAGAWPRLPRASERVATWLGAQEVRD